MTEFQVDAFVRYGPRAKDYRWKKYVVRASGKRAAWGQAKELARPGRIVGSRINRSSLLR